MSARHFSSGRGDAPRKTHETPRFVCHEYPEHTARAVAAIRARRLAESVYRSKVGQWA